MDRVAYVVDDHAFTLGVPVGVVGMGLIQSGHDWLAMVLCCVASFVVAHLRSHEADRRSRDATKIDE